MPRMGDVEPDADNAPLQLGCKVRVFVKKLVKYFTAAELAETFGSNWKSATVPGTLEQRLRGRSFLVQLEGGSEVKVGPTFFEVVHDDVQLISPDSEDEFELRSESSDEELDASGLDAQDDSFDDWTEGSVPVCQRSQDGCASPVQGRMKDASMHNLTAS